MVNLKKRTGARVNPEMASNCGCLFPPFFAGIIATQPPGFITSSLGQGVGGFPRSTSGFSGIKDHHLSKSGAVVRIVACVAGNCWEMICVMVDGYGNLEAKSIKIMSLEAYGKNVSSCRH